MKAKIRSIIGVQGRMAALVDFYFEKEDINTPTFKDRILGKNDNKPFETLRFDIAPEMKKEALVQNIRETLQSLKVIHQLTKKLTDWLGTEVK